MQMVFPGLRADGPSLVNKWDSVAWQNIPDNGDLLQ